MSCFSSRSWVPVLVVLVSATCVRADPGRIYWTDSTLDRITRTGLDGGVPEIVLSTGLEFPEGIVVRADVDEIWWADGALGAILKSDLDGAFVETVISGVTNPAGLAIDAVAGKVYWSNVAVGPIHRADLDGTNVELVVPAFGHVRNLAIDPVGGKLYFTGQDNTKLQRANLDGTDVETLATGFNPRGIALDPAAGKVYWASDVIRRANLDGSDPEVVVATEASGLALDADAGTLYWTRLTSPYLQRAGIDGENVEDLVVSGPVAPRALALWIGEATGVPSFDGVDHASIRLSAPRPNPVLGATTLRWSTDRAATLRILDVSGRVVRSWTEPPGEGARRWDGRGASGVPVPGGVYLVELRSGVDRAGFKLVVVR
ncbi:MAG: hypothetical protein R3B81_11670 [bacterium]